MDSLLPILLSRLRNEDFDQVFPSDPRDWYFRQYVGTSVRGQRLIYLHARRLAFVPAGEPMPTLGVSHFDPLVHPFADRICDGGALELRLAFDPDGERFGVPLFNAPLSTCCDREADTGPVLCREPSYCSCEVLTLKGCARY